MTQLEDITIKVSVNTTLLESCFRMNISLERDSRLSRPRKQSILSSRHLWDRKLALIGEKVRLITTPDEIEEKLDWVKNIMEQTNKYIDEYNQEVEKNRPPVITTAQKRDKRQISDEKVRVQEIEKLLKRKFS